MKQIKELLKSDIPLVVQTTKRALELKGKYDNHEISEQEFNDLILDITRIDTIDENMYSLDMMSKIYTAFQVILTIKTFASI
jgi:AAA15 family ATPase/GTPase